MKNDKTNTQCKYFITETIAIIIFFIRVLFHEVRCSLNVNNICDFQRNG